MKKKVMLILLVLIISLTIISLAQVKLTFKDPKGDDKGDGNYIYPTDPIFVSGSFDLLECVIEDKGEEIDITVKFGAPVSFNWPDRWDTQQIQIYLDFDGKPGSGYTTTLPGTQVSVDPGCGWEKLILLDPHFPAKINSELDLKAKDMKKDIVVPEKVKPIGKSIKATIKKTDLGLGKDADISKWGYGILMLGTEGFPADWSVLIRLVNESEGQYRYGGGKDGKGDSNIIDMFAGNAAGGQDEAQIQYDMLKTYVSSDDPDNSANDKMAVIKFVYPGKK